MARFFDRLTELDDVLQKAPSGDNLDRFAELVKEYALCAYAFDHIPSASWLRPLAEKGFFSAPPTPVRDASRGTQFPFWPASHYLIKMASQTPEEVLGVVLRIPETENISVHRDFVEAALELPPSLAARWVTKEIDWIEKQNNLYMGLPSRFGDVISHLAKGGEVNAALALTRTLLSAQPDPRAEEKRTGPRGLVFPPEPRVRFDTWEYDQILKKNVPDLLTKEPNAALELLLDLLESVVTMAIRSPDKVPRNDYSHAWRPAIEEHDQNVPVPELRRFLVTAVRDACEAMAKQDPKKVPTLVAVLEAREWFIFHRIALHLLRVFPDAAPPLIVERLTDRNRFDELEIRHEYALLSRDYFGKLRPQDQQTILAWIDEEPDLQMIRAKHEEWTGKPPTDEEVSQTVIHRKLQRLAPISNSLPAEWKKRYESWVRIAGKPEHPEFLTYHQSWFGPTSPKGEEDLRKMTDDELFEFLKDWQPPQTRMAPSREGLGRAVMAAVAAEPDRLAKLADRIRELDPAYCAAILSGLHNALQAKRAFDWSRVLPLCRWVLEQKPETAERKDEDETGPNWRWARKSVANLFWAAFDETSTKIDIRLRQDAWQILEALSEDSDPTPEDEARYGGDPCNYSINTTRGQAITAVVRYALWVRRDVEKEADGQARVRRGFDEMPEVRAVLDAHLGGDPSPAIRSVYGQWLPWLVLLDDRWARSAVTKIFPDDNALRPLRDAAWEGYLLFCWPNKALFELLKDQYSLAAERLTKPLQERTTTSGFDPTNDVERPAEPLREQTLDSRNLRGRLAEHLMALYWQGILPEGDPIITNFYAKADESVRASATSFVGRSFYDYKGQIPVDVLNRCKSLWEWRLAEVRAHRDVAANVNELVEFGWWFASEKFDDQWCVTQLLEVLKLAHRAEPDHLVLERLGAITPSMPAEAVACLEQIIEGTAEQWGFLVWRDEMRRILIAARDSGNASAREAAIDLVHRLGARGFLELRDILPKDRR